MDYLKIPDNLLIQRVLESAVSPLPFSLISYSTTPGTNPGDNYTSIINKVTALFKVNGEQREYHFIFKIFPANANIQARLKRMNTFHREMEIYRTWIPELTRVLQFQPDDLPYAKFIYGKCMNYSLEEQKGEDQSFSPLDNFIVLEDMRPKGYKMPDRFKTLNIHELRLLMKCFAKIHSASWAYHCKLPPGKNIPEAFPFLKLPKSEQDQQLWPTITASNLSEVVQILDSEFGQGNKLSQAAEAFRPKLMKVFQFFLGQLDGSELDALLRIKNGDGKSEVPWRVISHGDSWTNNFLFRYDSEGYPVDALLVDMQYVHETCVVNDLLYSIYISTDTAFRKNHLEELLQHYHDEFLKYCLALKVPLLPNFCMPELKKRFHRGKLFAFFISVAELPVLLKDQEGVQAYEFHENSKNVQDMLTNVCTGLDKNLILRKRIVEFVQEMWEEGVI